MLGNIFDFNGIGIIVSFAMLGLASALDLKKREINDLLWICFAGVSVLMIFVNSDFWGNLKIIGISMMIAPISLILWRFGFFGGADAFCLIVLASLAPMATLTSTQITPFTTLTNAAILSIVPLFVNLARNLIAIIRKQDIFKDIDETSMKKILAMFIGYKTKNPKYSFPMEQVIDGKKHLDFSLKHAEKTAFCSDDSGVWVTPGLPYILYISAGFVIQVFFGDLIFNVIHSVRI
jgi:preflagellin peptidase FlaK